MGQTLSQTYADRLSVTLPEVRSRMHEAALSAGRDPETVRLIAVTKAHPIEAVEAAIAAGLQDLGENRVEELEGKVEVFGGSAVRWHMIGHVQSRKARRVAAVADLIHSVDTLKLGEKLSRSAVEDGRVVHVLAQVNTSGEAVKSGFASERAMDEVHALAELPGLKVDGLMTMAPFVDDQAVLGATFEGLRSISDRIRATAADVGPELSMGMTNDMEIAIREGSTMVRIGTALFGERGRT